MEKEQLILAIDQGTTSSRAIVFNKKSKIVSTSQMEFGLICPKSGWVEQNIHEIWATVFETVKEVITSEKFDPQMIKAIGITNQRETTVLWDKITGEPVYNAIVWQSRQSQDICEEWINKGYSKLIQDKTGLLINPYFSASKVKWIFDNVPGVLDRAKKGEILFGTIDTYLVWKLTKGAKHVTDYSNASRTMMFNINTLRWDEELLNMYGIPKCILPEVVNSNENLGIATRLKEIDKDLNIPICSIIGDQQASLFGQCCFNKGDVKSTYGTGCFMLMNTTNSIVKSKNGLLTTIAWGVNGEVEYALEGSVFVAGSAIQWLRDGMRMFEKSKDCEKYSRVVDGSDGVYVVPAFVGLGTPYWDNDARGAVFGLTRATKKEHFVNATVESIAYQAKDVMEVMKEEACTTIRSLGVDGGASANNYLMQFQADILNCKILRPNCLETTALGAAYLAGLTSGVYSSKEELVKYHTIEQIFVANMSEEKRNNLYTGWKKAVEATRIFKL